MATASPAGVQSPSRSAKNITDWHITVAVLFILLGMFAIIGPALTGLAVSRLIGWLLIFGGLAHLIGACAGRVAKKVIL